MPSQRKKKKGTSECDTIVEEAGKSRTRWPWNRRQAGQTAKATFQNHDEKRQVAVCLETPSLVQTQVEHRFKVKAGIEFPILAPPSLASTLDFRRLAKKVLAYARPTLFKLDRATVLENGRKCASKRTGLPISLDNNARTHLTLMSQVRGSDRQIYTQFHEERLLHVSRNFTYNIKKEHLNSVIRVLPGSIDDNLPRQPALDVADENGRLSQPDPPVAGDNAVKRDKKKAAKMGSHMSNRVLMTHQTVRPDRCRKLVSFRELKHNRRYILDFGKKMLTAKFLSGNPSVCNFELPSGKVRTFTKDTFPSTYLV